MLSSLPVLWAAATASPPAGRPTTPAPLLPSMLSIDWQRLPDAQGFMGSKDGFQNSDGGWVSADSVVAAFGHGHGSTSESSFFNTAYLLNVTAAAGTPCRGVGAGCNHKSWQKLPDAPVSGRQDVASAVIGGAVYIVGGFSYSAPFSFADFLRLGPDAAGKWSWTTLPSFPYPLSMHAVSSIGSKLYVQGGACYNRKAFFNWVDCLGGTAGLGKRLYVFDVADPLAKWIRLPDLPGPPKANAALSSVNGSLFVLGGMSFVPNPKKGPNATSAMTLVDNWRFDPARGQWSQLVDLPVASGNFQTNGPMTAFEDRYIILIGGCAYRLPVA